MLGWFYELVEKACSPCLEDLPLCRRVPCVDCVCLVILLSWKPTKCEMGFSQYWDSKGMALVAWPWGPWEGLLAGHLGVLSWLGEDGRPAAGEGCTPGKAPAESPVPSHPNAYVQSRLLRSTLANSCIGYPAGPIGGVESGSVLVSLSP